MPRDNIPLDGTEISVIKALGFSGGEVSGTDLIDVSGMDAQIGVSGNQAFNFIGNAAFSGAAGELRYMYDGTGTFVQADVDGDGVADMQIAFTGSVALAASDFVL